MNSRKIYLRRFLYTAGLMLLVGWLIATAPTLAQAGGTASSPRYLMAHYMPWYEARPYSRQWGWHWTMNRFSPDRKVGDRREAASHYYPLLGLYDSGDPDLLECHVLLMKLAGIDGVILDWYGPDDYLDYGLIHRNCERLIPYLKKAGLRFAVCYEDQTVTKMIEGKRLAASAAVEHGQHVMRWLQTHWFRDRAYLKLDQRPLFLVFGPQYYPDDEWPRLFRMLAPPPLFVTLHHRRGSAQGGFDWPLPAPDHGLKAVDAFYRRARDWPVMIPAAFPRFHDIYKEAGVRESYGRIPDQGGQTYRITLERALKSKASVIQIATWNDWGEGTIIEPSCEFGYRDLETTQQSRKKFLEPSFSSTGADLRLPVQLFNLRKKYPGDPQMKARLDMASRWLFAGKPNRARAVLRGIRMPERHGSKLSRPGTVRGRPISETAPPICQRGAAVNGTANGAHYGSTG